MLWNVIYSYDGKSVFSASLFQSSVSQDPSEIIFTVDLLLKKYLLLLSMLKTVVHNILFEPWYNFFVFRFLWWIERSKSIRLY